MVKRISFLFVLVLLISTSIYAQEYALSKHQISAAYFGEILTHKGIRIGYSINEHFAKADKSKKEG